MGHKYFILLFLLPLYAFSQSESHLAPAIISEPPVNKNSIVKSYSNELDKPNQQKLFERTTDYPTQIIRLSSNLEAQQIDCDQVNDIVEKTIVQNITSDKFTYNIYIVCNFNPDTRLAKELLINSYFDPLNDQAIEFLKSYLAQYNDSDFLGTKLKIESAKALVISLNLIAGTKKNPQTPLFTEYRKDRSNLYFSSNYEMKQVLVTDIYQNFFSNDPNKVLPFINKWLFSSAGALYKTILRDSNFVELQPERIFIMNNGDEIFVSQLKYYFAHNCTKYKNQHCLTPEI